MRISPWASALASGAAVASVMLVAPAVSSTTTPTATTTATDDCPVREYAMGLRYQQSAHAAAAQIQAWDLAESRLKKIVADHRPAKDLAIVTDLDETVWDNTPLFARDLQACQNYTTWATWSNWEINGHPQLTPGAKRFFDFADRHGVSIYYISDRIGENKEYTMAHLRERELPQVDADHVLLLPTTKEERRQVVAKDHEIVMLLGDSLGDFHADFAAATPEQQKVLVDRYSSHFGHDWIMFPNAAYGSWRKSALQPWDEQLR